jgi:NADPH:quinone reductase-like Zn-dependent oxidoreductase
MKNTKRAEPTAVLVAERETRLKRITLSLGAIVTLAVVAAFVAFASGHNGENSGPVVVKEIPPGSRVGIIGIGGLGHMAVKFAAAYGCDVTAFTSSESKFDEAKGFGANHVVSSRDSAAIKKLAGNFDLLISTVNVKLDWDAMIGTLAPNGRLHIVGAVLEPIPVAVTVFPGEQYQAPRSWTERAYPKLIYYNQVDKGGHFAAWEQPQLFAEELRAAFKSLRTEKATALNR